MKVTEPSEPPQPATTDVVAGAAHDFNNLLMVIMGHIDEALDASGLPSAARVCLEHALAAAERGAHLADNLMARSRSEADREQVAVNELVSGDLSLYSRFLGDDIDVVLSLDPTAGAALIDRDRLSQALLNLVVNARDAMPAGGKLRVRTIRERGADGADGTTISFVDTGQGIRGDVLDCVFDPLFTTKSDGHGTGLSAARSVIVELGGTICARSEPGSGAEFRVWLPAVTDESDAQSEHPDRLRPPDGVALVVDDDRQIRRLVAGTLRRRGFQVHEADDGAHALMVAEAIVDPLTLVVTDIRMPRVGGVELADELQTRFPQTPVLLVTGYADSNDLSTTPASLPSLVLMMTGYVDISPSRGPGRGLLHKPFTTAELLEAVDALRRPGRGRGLSGR